MARRLAEDQGGFVTRAQLLDHRADGRTVKRWIERGRLVPIHFGVYAVGHLPTNPIDWCHAALLACGEQAALAGESAMVLWQQWKRWPAQPELVSSTDRRPSGLTVHHSRTLLARDVRVRQGLRVTSPARMLLDMATRLKPAQLARSVNNLRLERELTVTQLADIVERNPRSPGARLLIPHIDGAQREPTRSELEDRFMALIERCGLPVPQLNVHILTHRVDAFFPEQRLIIELDGWASHRTRAAFARDRQQDAEILAATGIPTVRLTHDQLTDERLKRLLAAWSRAPPPPQ